jgi:AcrR family transcriptional regulator
MASEEGLEGLTIGRLSTELGLSKSGLFGHFGSKEELQLATVDAAARIFYDRVVGPSTELPDGLERLHAMCTLWVRYLEDEVFKGGCFFAAATAEFDGRPGPVRDKLRQGQEALSAELMRQATVAGAAEPEQLAFEIHSIVLGANAGYQLFGERRIFALARTAIERRLAEV